MTSLDFTFYHSSENHRERERGAQRVTGRWGDKNDKKSGEEYDG